MSRIYWLNPVGTDDYDALMLEALQREAGYRARRWVVERAHSWMNRFRRILIRWEKKAANYLALLHFACAWITFRAADLLG